MDWNLKAPSPGCKEFEQEPNSNTGAISGSSSLGGHGNKGDFFVGSTLGPLIFGSQPVDNLLTDLASGSSKRARAVSIEIKAASCQVDGCQADLSGCRPYHRRHKVCERHSTTPEVKIGGQKLRFCQHCSRFHFLAEFDEGKRSCRKRLDGHNQRRRKSEPEPLSRAGNFLSKYQGFPIPNKQDLSKPDPKSGGERDSTHLPLNYFMQGPLTPDKQNSSKPDPNSRGEEDSEGLQMQMHQHSDATFSISDREHTTATAPDGGVSYMEESMMPLNEMGEVVAKRQKLSPEDKESLTRRETSNSSEEELMEEMWLEELEETPSGPRKLGKLNCCPMEVPPTISHHFSILHVLDFSYSEIKILPQSISRLVALQKLYLRSCELLMQLPPEIGELTNLEVLDLEGTELLCLPKEIANLVKLTCLRVSFYGYANQTVIPRKVLPNLSRLNELIIDVTPYGEWWAVEVEAIIDDLRSLKKLRALKLYLPTAELLEGLTLIFLGLANFRFTVGCFEEHFISRLPHDVEEEFNNRKKLEKGLKYVNGDRIPNEITKVFKHVNAFFLQCHWTANSLSEFGHENLNEVKFCLVMECNEFRTIIDSEQFYQGNDGRAKSEDFQDFDEAIVLGSLERLIVRYMKNVESIWKGPVGKGSLFSLKSLALHTCPNLTTLFTIEMLSNLINLEELIVEDCPKIDSLVSLKNSGSKSGPFLPSLKKISLLELPGLVSISSGLCIAPKLERMVIFYCPKLEKLSTMDLSSTNLKVIKGEEEWWNALKWYESDLSTEHEDYLASLFIPLRRNGDLFAQLTED